MTAQLNPQRDTRDYQQLDAAHHIHAFLDQKALNREGPRVMVRGDGLQLWDNDGKRYLDGMSGLWCTNLGYGRQDLAAAASRQLEQLPYYNMFFHTSHPAVVELSEMLFSLLPDHYSHAIYTNSGSEANEVLIRTVRRYWQILGKPQKKIMIGRWNGYHGSTVAGVSLGGMKALHEQGDFPIPGIVHIAQPYWYGEGGDMSPDEFGVWAAEQLEKKILEVGEENVAAFIAEPIQGAGGVIVPPAGYHRRMWELCQRYDVLYISDEVVTSFGRLGHFFASQAVFGVQPDIILTAKGLTSGYQPLGACIFSRRIWEVIAEPDKGRCFSHGFTYSGHPVACAAALKNIEIIEREGLLAHADEVGRYSEERLQSLRDLPIVGDVRGMRFMACVEFVADKASK
ncbi:aminotransferase, partial [Acinetobacter baumannii]